jgi:iron complex outermembrane receptor protein
MRASRIITSLFLSVFFVFLSVAFGQKESGTLRGKVVYAETGSPLQNVSMQVVQLKLNVQTDEQGYYEIQNLPPGTYTIIAHLEGFPNLAQSVTINAGGVTNMDFQMRLTGVKEQVTITASGDEQSTFDSFQSVSALDTNSILEKASPSLGEVLEKEPGVAKRSFGPGSSRPVIRGFDGDRVLVLQDGIRAGSIGSQSGDHGEPVDPLAVERLEVVKGPATLLYGSNALGGVVNAISGSEEDKHPGLRGYLSGVGGSNAQGVFSGGVEYGFKNWLIWGNGSLQRTGDYDTPLGKVFNSKTRSGSGAGGAGYYGDKGFFNASYQYDRRRYGIPFASIFEGGEEEEEKLLGPAGGEEELEPIDLLMRSHNFRVKGGFHNVDSFVTSFRGTLNYTKYKHQELEGDIVGTNFFNDTYSYRGLFDQRKTGRLTGRFGFEGYKRSYETQGAEALIQGEVAQSSFSAFALEELNFDRVKFQLGGRVENNRYRPDNTGLPKRAFTGFSGAAGVRFGLWTGGALVVNYTRSDRAPALEELYNNGPHIGTLTFEIGNSSLRRERGDGLDFSVRHLSSRFRAEANFFYYDLKDFVFLSPTGEIADGLPVAEYLQGNSRYKGAEINFDALFQQNFSFNGGIDYVKAELKTGLPLPRIPPLRGRLGFDARYKGFSLRPEAVFVSDQDRLYTNETRTAGYALFNLIVSYTTARDHSAHIISLNGYNLGDRLYRNHLSFIKELAPEQGRGIRLTYTVRFF